MKELVVISGKGGTGKTSLTAAFAHLGAPLVLADCDVDAADLHLLAQPTDNSCIAEVFESGTYALVDESACTGCGICDELCRFDAVSIVEQPDGSLLARIDALACEGCGVCVDHCPTNTIEEHIRQAGELISCHTRFGMLVYGRLDPGQHNSGKLVALVRERAKATAEEHGADVVLIDGPPGVGCPVIASLGGVDMALIVVEPTVSSLHDMQRVLDLCHHFNTVPAVIINKADLNIEIAQQIEHQCTRDGIAVLGSIGYDNVFVQAMVAGKTITEAAPNSQTAKEISAIWTRIQAALASSPFDTLPDRYDAWFDTPMGKAIFAMEVACLKQLQPSRSGRWLEVGVGSGRFAESLGVQEGVDPSVAMLDFASSRGISAKAGTGETLPYPDDAFDGLLMVVTICFLDNPQQTLQECARVLKKGGAFIVGLVPADSAWGKLYADKGQQGHPFYESATFYTCTDVIELAEQAGFTLEGAASTLLQPPGDDPPLEQLPVDGIASDAGFVAMRFKSLTKD